MVGRILKHSAIVEDVIPYTKCRMGDHAILDERAILDIDSATVLKVLGGTREEAVKQARLLWAPCVVADIDSYDQCFKNLEHITNDNE